MGILVLFDFLAKNMGFICEINIKMIHYYKDVNLHSFLIVVTKKIGNIKINLFCQNVFKINTILSKAISTTSLNAIETFYFSFSRIQKIRKYSAPDEPITSKLRY